MRRNLLITTAAAAILAATGFATAQDRGGKPAGAMEKGAPQGQMRGEQRGQAQTPAPGGANKMNERRGQAPDAQKQKRPSGAAERPDKSKSKQQSEGARPADKNMQKSDTDRRPGSRQSEDARQRDNQKNGARQGAETTGRGDASGAQLTNEQRTRIRQVVVSQKIPKVDRVDFTVSVGARVPATVRFHPIPAEIVTIYPTWRGYRVILVGSELVIVHPRTYQIVAVIVV